LMLVLLVCASMEAVEWKEPISFCVIVVKQKKNTEVEANNILYM
jgi:hypothetical protein